MNTFIHLTHVVCDESGIKYIKKWDKQRAVGSEIGTTRSLILSLEMIRPSFLTIPSIYSPLCRSN